MDKTDKNRLTWFLTNRQLLIYICMLVGLVIMNVINIMVTLKFIAVQQLVQNGMVTTNWKLFLSLSLALTIISASLEIYATWFELKINTFLRVNLFLKYRKIIQLYEKTVHLKMHFVCRIFGIIATLITVVLNCYLAVKTSELVEFSYRTIIGSILIMVLSVIFGILRGLKRAKIDDMSSTIQTKEADLTKFFTFSKKHMENALHVLTQEYNQKNKANVITSTLSHFPVIIKEIVTLISVYGLVEVLAENTVYSNAYIITTAYTTTLTIAKAVSSIFEDVFSCIKISHKEDIKILDLFEKKELIVLAEAKSTLTLSKDKASILISQSFTADVKEDAKTIRHYSVRTPLSIKFGEHILLIGNKGTGKTRFLQLLEASFEKITMIYNDRTKVFNHFYDNFKGESDWNYELIQELARGLKLKRFILPESELRNLTVEDINTGDSHLYTVMVMLYYAISNPSLAKLIILDEIFANVDRESAEDILKFIIEKVNHIGSSIIFVGHSQQKMLQPYCQKVWTLKANGSSVDITEKRLK